jgi:hypothetical protein
MDQKRDQARVRLAVVPDPDRGVYQNHIMACVARGYAGAGEY